MAVGFPARVVSKHPDFPRELSTDDRVRLLKEIIDAMVAYWGGFDIACRAIAPERYAMVARHRKRFKTIQVTGELQVAYTVWPDNPDLGPTMPSVLLSLEAIPDMVRKQIERHNGMWIDIANKARSDQGNAFGEEVVQFLRRYGVRFYRIKSI